MPEEAVQHKVSMRLRFESEIEIEGAHLAAELTDGATVTLDGKAIDTTPAGFYVDHAIRTYALPTIQSGKHLLEITMPYGARNALEWCYILGNFGVFAAGSYTVITDLPEKLAFGDITRQYLPFYSGKITYHLPVTTKGERIRVWVPTYRAATVLASVNGGEHRQLDEGGIGGYFHKIIPFGREFLSGHWGHKMPT